MEFKIDKSKSELVETTANPISFFGLTRHRKKKSNIWIISGVSILAYILVHDDFKE